MVLVMYLALELIARPITASIIVCKILIICVTHLSGKVGLLFSPIGSWMRLINDGIRNCIARGYTAVTSCTVKAQYSNDFQKRVDDITSCCTSNIYPMKKKREKKNIMASISIVPSYPS
jgi:hypothetical protein